MEKTELRKTRKQMIAQMEHKLHETWSSEEDSLFYYHRSEDRIVLSHALFWVMSQSLKGKIRQEITTGSWSSRKPIRLVSR